jgi:hypothetical protein
MLSSNDSQIYYNIYQEIKQTERQSTGCLLILLGVCKHHKLGTTAILKDTTISVQLLESHMTWLSSDMRVRGTNICEGCFRNLADKFFPPFPRKCAGRLDTN